MADKLDDPEVQEALAVRERGAEDAATGEADCLHALEWAERIIRKVQVRRERAIRDHRPTNAYIIDGPDEPLLEWDYLMDDVDAFLNREEE